VKKYKLCLSHQQRHKYTKYKQTAMSARLQSAARENAARVNLIMRVCSGHEVSLGPRPEREILRGKH